MISVVEAEAVLAQELPEASPEQVTLEHCVGRVLAQPVIADRDGPPFDRVAMDGYAVDSRSSQGPWKVIAVQVAGKPPLSRVGSNTAVEVATGAVLPLGCDCVIPYEATVRRDDVVNLTEPAFAVTAHKNVHRQGDDYHQSQVLLEPGLVLRAPHLHTLASVGFETVRVRRRALWDLVATGDELVDIGASVLPWQIRRSNAAAITGEAGAWGLSPSSQGLLPDELEHLRAGLELRLQNVDLLVLTGGVSAGVLDLVPRVLQDLGVAPLFHKIAQRPGKPLWCGRGPGPRHPLVVGLPGNPVSSLFAFRRYLLAWLLAFEGRAAPERRLRLSAPLARQPKSQTVFLPWAHSQGVCEWRGSGDFLALSKSDGFIQVDDDPRSLTEPRFFAWGGMT